MKRFLQACSDHVPTFVLAIMLGAGFLFSPADLPAESFCIFKRIFLIDCPGCGLTRAFLSIPRGRFWEALSYNVASVPLYVFFMTLFFRRAGAFLSSSVFRPVPPLFAVGYSFFLIFLLTGHWTAKTVSYFAEHPLPEYVSALKAQPPERSPWVFLFLRSL